MFKLRYYCQGAGKKEIRKILTDIQKKHGITYEILDLLKNGAYNQDREKEVYERDFKPRAKLLKQRTGEPITRLRSSKARNYFVSLPGTIAVIGNEKVEWYTIGDKDIMKFLNEVLDNGYNFLEECCKIKRIQMKLE